MATLEGSIICRAAVCSKFDVVSATRANNLFANRRLLHCGLWGSRSSYQRLTQVGGISLKPCEKRVKRIQCTFSSSSDDNGSMAGNFSESDEDYVNSSVIEAVEIRCGSDGFMIKMRDGRHLRCSHVNPQGGSLPDNTPHPAIVLKMEDGSDLLLPIIVLEMPSIMLMAAVRNVKIVRPTIYQVVQEMIDKMGYVVQLVRVTKRVNEAYFAQLYLAKAGNEEDIISFDLRPSDAINMAVRCKVPIQVNKHLVYSDGMREVEPARLAVQAPQSGMRIAELDRPDGQPCFESAEFDLVRNMLVAAVEERYKDAAKWRDRLYQLRYKKKNWTSQ